MEIATGANCHGEFLAVATLLLSLLAMRVPLSQAASDHCLILLQGIGENDGGL